MEEISDIVSFFGEVKASKHRLHILYLKQKEENNEK